MKRYVTISLVLLGLLLLLLPFSPHLLRPSRTDQVLELFQGVTYVRDARQVPRPLVVHLVTIDLTAPGVRVLVTPGEAIGGMEVPARTTSEFLTAFDLQLAINGGFFKPFHSNTPWDYYPHSGDPVDVTGLAISNGVTYSTSDSRLPVLCIATNGHAQINPINCPADTSQAIAGNVILVAGGVPVTLEDRAYYKNLHPRTAVAIDEAGQTLWLIVVDGRQTNYSEGVSLVELAGIAVEVGADTALNLDGGGSTTLVRQGSWRPRTLNAPIHTRLPMRQRPVANHLGIYALPEGE